MQDFYGFLQLGLSMIMIKFSNVFIGGLLGVKEYFSYLSGRNPSSPCKAARSGRKDRIQWKRPADLAPIPGLIHPVLPSPHPNTPPPSHPSIAFPLPTTILPAPSDGRPRCRVSGWCKVSYWHCLLTGCTNMPCGTFVTPSTSASLTLHFMLRFRNC